MVSNAFNALDDEEKRMKVQLLFYVQDHNLFIKECQSSSCHSRQPMNKRERDDEETTDDIDRQQANSKRRG